MARDGGLSKSHQVPPAHGTEEPGGLLVEERWLAQRLLVLQSLGSRKPCPVWLPPLGTARRGWKQIGCPKWQRGFQRPLLPGSTGCSLHYPPRAGQGSVTPFYRRGSRGPGRRHTGWVSHGASRALAGDRTLGLALLLGTQMAEQTSPHQPHTFSTAASL